MKKKAVKIVMTTVLIITLAISVNLTVFAESDDTVHFQFGYVEFDVPSGFSMTDMTLTNGETGEEIEVDDYTDARLFYENNLSATIEDPTTGTSILFLYEPSPYNHGFGSVRVYNDYALGLDMTLAQDEKYGHVNAEEIEIDGTEAIKCYKTVLRDAGEGQYTSIAVIKDDMIANWACWQKNEYYDENLVQSLMESIHIEDYNYRLFERTREEEQAAKENTVALSIAHDPETGMVSIASPEDVFYSLHIMHGDSINMRFSNGYTLEDIPYYTNNSKVGEETALVKEKGHDFIVHLYNFDDLWETAGLSEGDTVNITLNEPLKY